MPRASWPRPNSCVAKPRARRKRPAASARPSPEVRVSACPRPQPVFRTAASISLNEELCLPLSSRHGLAACVANRDKLRMHVTCERSNRLRIPGVYMDLQRKTSEGVDFFRGAGQEDQEKTAADAEAAAAALDDLSRSHHLNLILQGLANLA